LRNCVDITDSVLQKHWADLESKAKGGLKAMHFAAIGSNTVVLLRFLESGSKRERTSMLKMTKAIHLGIM